MLEFKRTGEVYGALTVIKKDSDSSRETYWWLCRCKCGESRKIRN